ncbi:SDR family NAD(P)-dependent oxidoreductase [Sinorhizobium americanum]|uniref:Short chain dehydrogenase/reductase family oxidoreductase n=1 Tax=Sinorhizobium americanum TaxID=194963 RepID=A0A1L3LYQ6_9HYPH|nr:SDR family oxidoreductase [Sinorhizobium americanum]APG95235.1 short chain dehydrogenase/reductase family oxidoreductase [Sinorhizobium americanum]OAP39761.1 oxidoreductase [Sinorhizobium americanum]
MDLQLRNKTAIVTGSTAGIGLAIARSLASEGATVFISGRSEDKLDAAVAAIGFPVRAVRCNATTAEGAAQLIEAAPEADILVNNLGIYDTAEFANIADEDWQNLFNVNVMSGVRLSRHYLPKMMGRNWGRIIFIASDCAAMVIPDLIHYSATKTAQLSISRGLAETTRGSRVTVNSVLPSSTRAEGTEGFVREAMRGRDMTVEEREKAFFKEHRPLSLIQRMIEPEEVAALVTYLSSPLAGAINGAALRIDGGNIPTLI